MITPFNQAIGSVFNILNYHYLDTWPVEVFYMQRCFDFFGGYSVYYLGYYGYATAITDQAGRSTRMARYSTVWLAR